MVTPFRVFDTNTVSRTKKHEDLLPVRLVSLVLTLVYLILFPVVLVATPTWYERVYRMVHMKNTIYVNL